MLRYRALFIVFIFLCSIELCFAKNEILASSLSEAKFLSSSGLYLDALGTLDKINTSVLSIEQHVEVVDMRAKIYLEMNQLELALKAYQLVSEILADTQDHYLYRHTAERNQRELKEKIIKSKNDLERLSEQRSKVDSDVDASIANLSLAILYHRLGKHEKTIEILLSELNEYKTEGGLPLENAVYVCLDAYLKSGQLKEGLKLINRYDRKQFSKQLQRYFLRFQLIEATHDHQKIRKVLAARFHENDLSEAVPLMLLLWLSYQEKNYEEVVSIFEKGESLGVIKPNMHKRFAFINSTLPIYDNIDINKTMSTELLFEALFKSGQTDKLIARAKKIRKSDLRPFEIFYLIKANVAANRLDSASKLARTHQRAFDIQELIEIYSDLKSAYEMNGDKRNQNRYEKKLIRLVH